MNSTAHDLAMKLGEILSAGHRRIATAESCTGGLMAAIVTDIPGSSGWFERGFVAYSNEAKQEMLGVTGETLELHGAVSEAVARAMAAGALKFSRADVAVAVTGIAGPDGGSEEKPVGTVWLAWAWPDGSVTAERRRFPGGRDPVRRSTVEYAFRTLIKRMDHDFRRQHQQEYGN